MPITWVRVDTLKPGDKLSWWGQEWRIDSIKHIGDKIKLTGFDQLTQKVVSFEYDPYEELGLIC